MPELHDSAEASDSLSGAVQPDPVAEKARQSELAIEWLKQRSASGTPRCIVCGQDEWSVTEVVELRPYTGGGLAVGGPVYPVFQTICTTCGHTLLFNAVIAGVLKADDE